MFAFLLAGSCTGTSEPAPAPKSEVATAPSAPIAARQSAPSLGFLRHIDASHETVAYVGDVLPWLSRLSHSDVFRRIATDAWILGQYPTAAASSAVMDVWLDEHKDRFPVAIAVGVGKDLGPMFARAMRMSLVAQGSVAAIGAEDGQPLLKELRQQFAADIAALRVPSLVVWMQMADDAAATTLLDGARAVKGVLPPTLSVQESADSITITAKLDAFVDRATLLTMLANVGLVESTEDTAGLPMVDVILALTGEASITRHGAELVVRFGPPRPAESPAPRARESLGPLFQPEAPELVAWAGWDMRATTDVNAETAAMIERWRSTDAGDVLLANDVEDLAGTVLDLQRTLVTSPPRGEARVDIQDELRITAVSDAPKTSTTLASTGLVEVVPGDAIAVHLDATEGFGDAFAARLEAAEERLYRDWIKNLLKDDASATAREELIQKYHLAFAKVRQLVLRDGRDVFAAPYATVVSAAHSSNVGFASAGESIRVPVPAFAIFMVPAPRKDAAKWLDDVNRETARAVFVASGERTPADRPWTIARDLGLGVPTRVVDLGWIDEVLPAGTSMTREADAVLHHFEHRGFIVLSTSVALSKSIRDGGATSVTPPLDALAYTRATGAGLADVVIGIADALEEKTTALDTVFRWMAIISRATNDYVMTTRARGESQRETVYRLTLAK